MEIHTNRPRTEQDLEIAPASDQSMYLRRKATQRLRRSHFASRRLMGALHIIAKLGAFVLVVAFLVSIFVYAYNSDKFTLRNVTIYGCKQLDARRLEGIIRENFPSNLLRIDLKQVRSLLEDEAWAKQVEIRRVLPFDLLVYIQERVPSVILEMQGELMLADEDGMLLDKYDPKYGKLDVPVFRGVLGDNPEKYRLYQEENSARIQRGLKLLSDLDSGSPAYAKNISEVDLSDKSNLKVLLVDDTAEVLLGDRDFLKRFRILMSNLTQYRELKSQYVDIASVDLRFDGQIIYRPKRAAGGQTVPAAEAIP